MAEFHMDDLTMDQINDILTQSEFEEILSSHQPLAPDPQIANLANLRFQSILQEDEVMKFIQDQENDNTRRKTESDMKLFKAYCTAKSENRPIESLSPIELDSIFGNFLINVKKQNGDDYEPSSISGFVSSLDRYLKGKRYPHQVIENNLFPHVNSALRAKMQYLKSQGHGNRPNESDELTDKSTASGAKYARSSVIFPHRMVFVRGRLMQ